MKTNLQMDFLVDKERKTITVKREFAAPVGLVWAAWTEPKLLDQWWAPKPWKTETQKMDFRPGGVWLYAMVGPEGERHFARVDYETINVKKSFSGYDAFSDSEGEINKELPRTKWDAQFGQEGENTLVHVLLGFNSIEDLEQLVAMGFKEGFLSALDNLDELLDRQ